MIKKLYNFALELYFRVRPLRLKELVVGTKAWEDYWIRCNSGRGGWQGKSHDWVEGIWESRNFPHRELLVESVAKFKPKRILEIGCACGPNLYVLAERFPEATIWGVDINRRFIDYGQEQFYKAGMKNVWLCVGRADNLLFAENTFDVVFTDAMLIYIGRDKIIPIIERFISITKKGLILVERHMDGVGALGVYRDGLWQRDYRELLGFYVPKEQITIIPIPKSIWPEWGETGCIIEVKL